MQVRTRRDTLIETVLKVTLVWTIAVLNCLAAEYHVAKNGVDAGSGDSSAPWLTIQKASNTVIAGDIVRVHAGSYTERVAESTDGSAGNTITYVADGAVIVTGFDITGDYVRIIGFEITHPSAVGYDGIDISNASHVEIFDCNIHHTDGYSIDPVNAPYLTIRGNIMNYSGSPGNNGGPGLKTIDDWGAVSNNVLIEYNTISHTTDYICSNGDYYIARNNVLGPSSVDDFGGTPHVDGWQANSQTRYGFMEANWHVNNPVNDAHMILIEAPVSGANGHFAVVKNVSLRSGDQLWFQMRDGDNLHAAHNSVGQIGYGPRGGPGSSGFFYVWSENSPSNNNFSCNNIFYNVTTGVVYTINSGSDLTHTNDHVDLGTDITNGINGNIKSNPVNVSWTDYDADDLLLKNTAPDIDAGSALTTVTSASGTGSSFIVANPDWFYDGFTLTQGQNIYVGNDNNLIITAVNYATGSITVSSSFAWISGDAVGYAYRGRGPDMGAYEYGDILLSSAVLSNSGSDYSVATNGDARFVIFYREGIPSVIDYTVPYAATFGSGAVTAKVYALHAQDTPVIIAASTAIVRPLASSMEQNKSISIYSRNGDLFIVPATMEASYDVHVVTMEGRLVHYGRMRNKREYRIDNIGTGVFMVRMRSGRSGTLNRKIAIL
jgi:hypothetical protein